MGKKLDLSNKLFGRLTAVSEHGYTSGNKKRILWLCKCACGKDSVVTSENLRSGNTQSCGCLSRSMMPWNGLDLVGKQFGRLLVVEKYGKTLSGMTLWLCECVCGNRLKVQTGNLTSGHTKSCGCYSKEVTSRSHLKDLTGKRFGRVLVVERYNKINPREVWWSCKCNCGKEFVTTRKRLLNGQTQSCGCLHRERISKENSHWWKEDRSLLVEPFKSQIVYLLEYNDWRKYVFNRDDCVCQRCGITGGNLHAHHIIPFSKIINGYNITTVDKAKECALLFSVDNGVTLCEVCHRWMHSNKNINKEFTKELLCQKEGITWEN